MAHQGSLTRRGFLASATAAGSATLLARLAGAQKAVSPAADVAGKDLTASSVEKVAWKARPFPLTDVRLLPSQWKDMMELNRGFLYSIPNDRLAHNFRMTAGIATDATPLGGWEAPDCELRGHYVGHYLSACALMHASTGDADLRDKANALVAMLAETQAKDGYLGAYSTASYDKLRKHEKVWAPFYTYHKIMAGLLDMYEHTGNAQALAMAVRMADWADTYSASFTPDEWQKVLLVEQGGMNEAAFNLYAITGKPKYRDLGYRFEHKKIFEPLAAGEDKLGGNHANTNIPKVIGAARGYELTGDERYNRISRNFYRDIVEHHSYNTGGTSNGEFWQKPDEISTQLGAAAQECCCAYNMMKLSRHLFGQEPDAAHFDYYERMMVNVRHGTQDRNGMLMYYVPLEPGKYKTFGTPYDAFWCCTGTGSEEYAKLNDSIYFHDDDSVFVNLYIPSRLSWVDRGLGIEMTTKYPAAEKITLRVTSAPKQATALKLRIPYWATKGATIRINGAEQTVPATPTSYARLEHAWQVGDVVELTLPMSLHMASAADDPAVQGAMYGPLALAVLMGREGLSTAMIYGDSGPFDGGHGMPLPEVRQGGVWLEQAEATNEYPLRFRSSGPGIAHTLVPLSHITDERYSVYVRNVAG
ncbi:glycoside hydrolase family 127 protein [Acidipila sp. EB88]|uniref:glycoside hydrolase family 127 protein n=1 Tax=Acidipila sp. EB88 TaxID=2305226 RepID=UPI000F5DE314|nr:glycoside hydrolase family 127 protein [Acidipila sp. EB88]RRA49370.1 glycoside hydrolase family 127 protein [Acidipila sp. EB88]